MSEETLSVVPANKPKPPVPVGTRGITIADLDGMWRWAQCVAKSGMAPKGMESPEAIVVATQMGLEIGLTPMAALQNIAVINGRPALWGDAQLGVVRATGELEKFDEWYEVGGKRQTRNPQQFTDDVAAVCVVKRRGYPEQEGTFSIADAKRAGLIGKNLWNQYPARMLRFRARSFVLRDQFGDALKGLLSAEEADDIPGESRVAPVFIPAPTDDAPRVVTGTDETVATPESEPSPAYGKLSDILAQEDATVGQLVAVMVDFPPWKPYAEGVTTVESVPLEGVEMMVKNQKALRLALRDAKKAGAE